MQNNNANLKLINMADVEREDVSWLVEPYLPFGKISIVQGDPSTGKTTVMLAIAADLTRGRELPDGTIAEFADVIFQTAEDGLPDTIKPRLEDMGADCSRIHVIDESDSPLSFSDLRIEQAIVETGAKLFILDPAQAYFSGACMNSADGVRPMMKSLAGVAERTGCAIVIIGHLNKNKGKSQYRGLGSIDIYAAARSVLTVGVLGENVRAVAHCKSNLAPLGKSFSFELDPETGFKWLGECDVDVDDVMSIRHRRESQHDKAKLIILSALSDGREVAANDIIETAKLEGVSVITLKRAKSELDVISTKKGNQWYWQIPIDAEFVEEQGEQEYQECSDNGDFANTAPLMLPLKSEINHENIERNLSL